jgi:hypothetical protein
LRGWPSPGWHGEKQSGLFAIRLATQRAAWRNAVALSWCPTEREPAKVALRAEARRWTFVVGERKLEVGPGKPFASIEGANVRARPGDMILVYPRENGVPYEQTAVFVRQRDLAFRAVPGRNGQRVTISGKGFDYSRNGATLEAVTGTYNWLSGGFGGAAGKGLDLRTNVFRRADYPLFANPAQHDYHLTSAALAMTSTPLSPARINVPPLPGVRAGDAEALLAWQYRHPAKACADTYPRIGDHASVDAEHTSSSLFRAWNREEEVYSVWPGAPPSAALTPRARFSRMNPR